MEKNNLLGFLVLLVIIFIFIAFSMFLIMRKREKNAISSNLTEYFSTIKLKSFKVKFLGWLIENDEESVNSFRNNAKSITWISPTSSYITKGGNLIKKISNSTIQLTKENGISVVPLIANEDFSREIVHEILLNKTTREKVVSSIVEFIVGGNYDGVNIDFENVDPLDRDNLTKFIKILSEEMHKNGKFTSIDVPAKTYDTKEGWSGAYDYKALGEVCDYLILMVYDYHWSGGEPGPVSPLYWLDEVLKYTTSVVQKEKIVIGIPFYGYDWYGGKGSGITFSSAINLAISIGAKVYFDDKSGEYYFITQGHEVWFQGAKSTELRLDIIVNKYNITKIAAWRLGAEDPRTWAIIQK